MTKGYKHLTKDQQSLVLTAYQRTLSTRATSDELGVTPNQVRTCLKRNGIPLSGARDVACYQRVEEIRNWAAEGLTFAEMGRRVGVKHQTVSKFLRRHNIPYTPFDRSAPENNPFWRGGRIVDKDGYILLKAPDHPNRDRHGYMREHRLVMESELGRYLTPREVVHHRDGVKDHNDPDNLEVIDGNGRHLAETLTGKKKNVSPEGRERLRANGRRRKGVPRTSIRLAEAPGD